MRVRVRGPGGAHTLTVAEDAPLSDLRLQIAEACFQGSSVERRSVFDLRFGFPPKTITSDVDGQQGVLALGIQDGEALQIVNVREDQGSIPDSGRNGGLVSQHTASAETSSRCEPVPQQALYPTSSPPMSGGTNPTGVTLIDGSELVKRVIPSDNSCLFNSVGRVMMDRDRDLRRVVANAVASDPTTYNEVFLEKSNKEYCEWILDKQRWGGAIELSILAKFYKTEIVAFDIQTKRKDAYGSGEGFAQTAMIIYDGLHYDALALSAFPGAPEEVDVTLFEIGSRQADLALGAAADLCSKLNEAKQFTDTTNFTLRCAVCQLGLRGEKEAQEHAKKTGHINFQEY